MIVHLDGFDKKEIKILFNSLKGEIFQKMKQVELVNFVYRQSCLKPGNVWSTYFVLGLI